jgi:Tol biopolymer transport system component
MTVSNYFGTLVVAAALAVLIAITLVSAEPARAAFPGTNGKIAFDSFPPGEADSEIFTLTFNPGGPVQEDPDPPLTGNTAQDSGAAWSPDGSQIAFVSERDGDLDIWAMKSVPETSNTGNNFPQNLTDDSGSGAFDSDPA